MRDVSILAPSANMNARNTEGLDLSKILSFGVKAVDGADPNTAWHREEDNPKGYHWHASQLGGCPRDAILKRAGLSTDGITLVSALTFQIGHLYHSLFEAGADAYADEEPRFDLLATETGGYHPDMPLAARCDILFRWQGKAILADYKTESPFAKQKRTMEAKSKGFFDAYKWEHQLQLAATAMVMEANCEKLDGRKITEGRLLYIDKSGGNVDQVVVPIGESDRGLVTALVEELEQHWRNFCDNGKLPNALRAKDELWRCRPRTEADAKGLYCGSRSTCFAFQEKGQ